MATYFVASGGSNTAPYDTWAKAATSLATALAASTADNDVVVIQYNAVPSGDAELSADTTYTFAGNIWLLSASNDGGSAYTPTAMGTGNWIGNSTTNRSISFTGVDKRCYVYGLTLRTAGSTGDKIALANGNGQQTFYDECYLWSGNTASYAGGANITLSASGQAYCEVRNSTFRFGNTGQTIDIVAGISTLVNCSISASGSTPTTLFYVGLSNATLNCVGCDFSLVTGTLVGNIAVCGTFAFDRCKFGSGVTVLASQTMNPSRGSPSVLVTDCHSGDTHMTFGYYDALGSVVTDTGIYLTATAAVIESSTKTSWKIVTTAYAGATSPFVTPWVSKKNTGTSAITPYLEIARDGSTTAFKDHEVWAEFSVKDTASSTQSSRYSDSASFANRIAASGSNQATGAGTGSWTGLSGTAWSGKCDSGSAVTPAEVGILSARLLVAAASTTLYVDPFWRS